MSFNKSKSMRIAERYLTQGKIQAAIEEYKIIVENDPKDVNTMNMLGDLYAKLNDNQAAINCYKQVADHYHQQGFAKKAISIYNKIYRMEPDSLEVSERLAELYRTRGSVAEAREHYLDISKRYEEKGHREKALEIWEIIGEIDPNNNEIYLKIAEIYWQDNDKEKAAKAFIEAAKRLSRANQNEAAVGAFSRALEILPENYVALNGFVKSQIQLGYPEEAAKALEELAQKDPYNKEIAYLLIDCYFEMDNPENAEQVIIKIVEREPANYEKLIDLIDVYLEKDDLISTVRILSMVSEHLLIDGKPEKLSGYIDEVLARNPEQIDALRLQARFYGWQKDELGLQKTLERLVEASRINESIEDERFALSQLLLLIPHDVNHSNRFKEINDNYDFDDEVVGEQLLGSNSQEVPDFDSFATLNDDNGSQSKEDFELETNGYSDKGFEANGFVGGIDAISFESNSGEIELNEDFADQEFDYKSEDIEGFESDNSQTDEVSSNEKEDAEFSLSDEREIEEELESVRFYVEQGYTGLAEKSLEKLETKFGKQPIFSEIWEEMGIERDQNESEQDSETPELQDVVENTVDENDKNVGESLNSEIVELSADAVVVESEEIQNVGVEIENVDSYQVEVLESTENVESEDSENLNETIDSKTHNDFDDFKNDLGLEESVEDENEDDYENHFHHAIAYKEMGLLEEAIREFQDAANCIKPNDGTSRFFHCCNLLGHCFMEKEMPNLALVWIKKAFETNNLSEEETKGLQYELANAYQANGDMEVAQQHFEEIYATDVDYRDVGERIEKLRKELVSQ